MKKEKLEQKLEIAKTHAISKGGLCLSVEYNNNTEHMTWKCENKTHQSWSASYKKVVSCGTWCPECRNDFLKTRVQEKKITAEERLSQAKEFAKSKNGTCLTDTPIKSNDLVLWKCENEQHQSWNAKHDSVVKLGSWCPECSLIKRAKSKTTIGALEIAKEHALKFGGKCISTEYIKARDCLVWQCGNKEHQPWMAWYDTVVRRGVWCKQCADEKRNISENRVRAIFETFFKLPFPSIRPTWNINPWNKIKGVNQYTLLELDGYCKEFNIAFEHDGEHHFAISKFSKNYKTVDFLYQQFKDEQKRKNCKKQGVLLINIPIINEKYRNDFDAVLTNVINCTEKYGLQMSFTDDEIQQLKDRF